MLKDTYRHKGMRHRLVKTLHKEGITSEKVLNALLNVPRHFFFDNAFLEKAYENKAFPIGEGQTISQPYTVAYQTQLLDVQVGDKILEIGTGSGYQACILAQMGAKVFTVERQFKLYKKTKQLLKDIGYYQVSVNFGDGYQGLPLFAPFDKIIITAAAPEIPTQLLKQLKIGGKMVVPLGATVQQMILITKTEQDAYQTQEGHRFRFVPMLKGTVR